MKKKRSLYWLGIILVIFLSLFSFRTHVLKAVGSFLIHEDTLENADAIFVLGGSPADRAREASSLYRKGISGVIICLGELVPSDLKIVKAFYPEAELTRMAVIGNGVPEASVYALRKGTSTMEEAHSILSWSREKGLKKIIILSSRFHTRRVHYSFGKVFKGQPVTLIIRGAASSAYSEDSWWKYENGLIMVNNEYLKLLYYFWKY